MALFFDFAFAEKLGNIAGITNEDVLSHADFMRGRAMLLAVNETLLHSPSDSIERTRLIDLATKLSVAVAPHKRVPLEILEHIFRTCIDFEEAGPELPPTQESIRQAPWVLGQVCRAWRHMSRSMPELWGTIHMEVTAGDFEDLKCASEILPDVARIRFLSGEDDDNEPFYVDEILPYLSPITEMVWHVERTVEQDSMTLFPSESLSRLVSLDARLGQDWEDEDEDPKYNMRLFGTKSRLRHLTLRSDAPSLLLTDIPWSQLLSFDLILNEEDLPAHWTKAIWKELFYRNPFSGMISLTELSLSLPPKLLKLILSYGFHGTNSRHSRSGGHAVHLELNNYAEAQWHRLPSPPIPEWNDIGTTVPFSLDTMALYKLPYTRSIPSMDTQYTLLDLSRLSLTVEDGSLLRLSLYSPAVTSLEIKTTDRARDIVNGAIQLITGSKMKLHQFTLWLLSEGSTENISPDLLNLLGGRHVDLRGVPLARECIQSLVSAGALQNVPYLCVTVSDPQDFIGIVKAQIAVNAGVRESMFGYSLNGGAELSQARAELEGLSPRPRFKCVLDKFSFR
ncbi:hypothetical protein H0H92_002816 [Tricholoma furcatifolium]|nr:hypothetical protein H0H92_002816 [Tricholoma furcatifolium]